MPQVLNTEQATALLDKLSSDDSFRDLFAKDLPAAFAQLPGKPAVPSDLTDGCCLRPVKLASKETMAQSKQKMIQGMSAMQPYIPKVLEG